MNTKVNHSSKLDTKIIVVDYKDLTNKSFDQQEQLKYREIFESPGIIIVDNVLDQSTIANLRLSLSKKKRKFKDKFFDDNNYYQTVEKAKLTAEKIIYKLTLNLFGYDLDPKKMAIRNMISEKEPMHYDSYFAECGKTPLMAIFNFDLQPRLWNIGMHFDELLVKKKFEFEELISKDKSIIPISIKLRNKQSLLLDSDKIHTVAFAPNSVWFTNPKIISHQLVYGGGILITDWKVKEPFCKCQVCIMKKNGYENEVYLTISHHKNNKKRGRIYGKFNFFDKLKKKLQFK